MALLKLGQPPIMSLTDDSLSAKRAAQEIEPALETVLRSYPWPFAVIRYALPRLQEKPLYKYAYYYEVPIDVIRIIEIANGQMPYELEGSKLATDATSVHIKYVSKNAALDRIDAQTKDVVACNLAARLCIIITENAQLQSELFRQYEVLLRQARNTWAVEDMPQTVIEGGWLPARHGLHGDTEIQEVYNPWGADGLGVSKRNG